MANNHSGDIFKFFTCLEIKWSNTLVERLVIPTFITAFLPLLLYISGFFALDTFLFLFLIECICLICLSTFLNIIIGFRNFVTPQSIFYGLCAASLYLIPVAVMLFPVLNNLPGWNMSKDPLDLILENMKPEYWVVIAIIVVSYIWSNSYLLKYKSALRPFPHYIPLIQGAGIPFIFLISTFSLWPYIHFFNPESADTRLFAFLFVFCLWYFIFEIWYFFKAQYYITQWKELRRS